MIITYYDKEYEEFVHIKNAKDALISLDYETGLLELSYEIARCYFSYKLPITTAISIGDKND